MTALAFNVSHRILQAFFGEVGGLPRTFWVLWGGSLMNRVGSMVMPMMAVYLTGERHLSVADAGAVVSCYGLGSLLSTQVGGVLTDRAGRRATMLVSLCTSAVSMLALGFSTTASGLMAAALALGFTADMYRPASLALLSDVVPPAHRVRAFGLLYWAFNLGFSIAAVVGGQLARWSFRGLFIIDAATTLAMAALVYRAIPETRPAAEEGRPSGGSFVAPFTDAAFLPFLLVHLVVVVAFFQFQVALPADMQSKGLGPQDVGFAMAINGVLIVALQPFVTRRLAHWPRSRALALACLCVGVGFGANVLAGTLPHFLLTVSIWTVGEIIMAPTNASIVADLSPADMRGRYQGAFGLVWSLGVVLGPWLSGHVPPPSIWYLCLALGAVAAIGHLALGRRRAASLRALGVEGARD